MPYKFIEHTADIAVEVEAQSINELLVTACYAWKEVALESSDTSSTDRQTIFLTADSYEELLVQLLNELNFLLYTKQWIFNSVEKMEIKEEGESFKLTAEILGNAFNKNIHRFKVEIKAVTFHQMKIENINNILKTKIIFDI